MKHEKNFEEDLIVKGIRRGDIVICCESLIESKWALAFCPERHECIALSECFDFLERDEALNVVLDGKCPASDNCPIKRDWLVIVVSKELITSGTCSPEMGRYIKEILKEKERE